jgi:3-oxoacyl-[acyl-carrier protein] reductase
MCFVNPPSLLRAALEGVEIEGRLVIVSGIASRQAFASLPLANMIRMAWLAEAKHLSQRLGQRRIRVNTLSLGGTLTEQFARRLENRGSADVPPEDPPEQIAIGEYGDPDDAAYVVVSLLSRLSNHITGINLASIVA